jgi:hypothetical protein
MASNIDEAKYTLRQIWLYTYKNYRSRFEYRDRDVLKTVQVREIKTYTKDRNVTPVKKFEIRSFSYPPYVQLKGKGSKTQRKVKHQYDCTFQFASLDWNSPFKWRIGSQRRYPDDDSKINYNQIKQLHKSVREKLVKKYGKGTKEYKKAVASHKKKAKYIDRGDYISQVFGINGDAYFRTQGNAYRSGNLFGIAWNKEKYGDGMPFFGKHDLRVVEHLLKKGLIKRD